MPERENPKGIQSLSPAAARSASPVWTELPRKSPGISKWVLPKWCTRRIRVGSCPEKEMSRNALVRFARIQINIYEKTHSDHNHRRFHLAGNHDCGIYHRVVGGPRNSSLYQGAYAIGDHGLHQ